MAPQVVSGGHAVPGVELLDYRKLTSTVPARICATASGLGARTLNTTFAFDHNS